MKRASQMGFLLCFLGILAAVPLLIALRGADNQTSYYENRTLAAMPEYQTADLLSGAYFSAWDTWLTDHIPSRDRLLGLNTKFDNLEIYIDKRVDDVIHGMHIYQKADEKSPAVAMHSERVTMDFSPEKKILILHLINPLITTQEKDSISQSVTMDEMPLSINLDIYVLGLPFMFFYNIATGIFSALGDSKTPFYFLAVSSLSNIGVDILFVAGFKWKMLVPMPNRLMVVI